MVLRSPGKESPTVLRGFSPDSCTEIGERVLALRSIWLAAPRDCDNPVFWTLGRCIYQDGVPTETEDMLRIQESNALLSEHFPDVRDRVAELLWETLGKEIHVCEFLPWPGFHIFGSKHSTMFPEGGSLHKDLQWEEVESLRDAERHLSFTMLIRQPAAGATILIDQGSATEPKSYRYNTGDLFLHSGDKPHRIGPVNAKDTELRITLQGHIALWRRHGIVYW
jgi:hypothetical protein